MGSRVFINFEETAANPQELKLDIGGEKSAAYIVNENLKSEKQPKKEKENSVAKNEILKIRV